MSYILDALRKADAERDRGNVPGIHAQPSFGGPVPTGAAPAARPWLWLAGGALAALVIGAVAWYLMAPTRAGVPPTAPVPIAAVPAPVTAPAPMPTSPPAATPKPVAPPPGESARPKPAPATTPAVRQPKEATPAASSAATPPPADAKPAATAEKVYAIAELPDDIRRQLPTVTVGGSMYSPKPADRILIINGQVLHEGDRIAPDLVLQQIRLKAALLNFKGYRYVVAF